jgi:hypothetical protein
MTNQPPALPNPPSGWGQDQATRFIDQARGNQFATFDNKRDWYAHFVAVDGCFVKVTNNWINPKDPITALLFLRCHAAFRTACMMAMAGQAAEVPVMHRSCLEYAAYAVHMHRSPFAARPSYIRARSARGSRLGDMPLRCSVTTTLALGWTSDTRATHSNAGND